MKKAIMYLVICAIVVAMIVPFPIAVSAATSGTTGACTWKLDGTVLTISGNGAMRGTYRGSVSPDDGSFDYLARPWGTSVTEVIIEPGVTSISDLAFYECENLKKVTIPSTVKTIGLHAFAFSGVNSVYITDMAAWCNIDYPKDPYVAGDLDDGQNGGIGGDLYLNGTLVTKLGIPKGVTSISDYAFFWTSITSVVIPDSVTYVGKMAFAGCDNLTSVTIGNGVTNINPYVFYGCNNLESVAMGEGVETIGDYAFAGCYKLEEFNIPESVTTIGKKAFYGCSGLKTLNISLAVKTIGNDAFGSIKLFVHQDSVGHNYALKNSNPYEVIEHTYDEITTLPSTCVVPGTESGVCNICGKESVKELPLADHTPEGEATVVPATCTAAGSETNHCSVCDEDYTIVIPMLEHSFKNGICTVCRLPDIQSDHPYANNTDHTWTHKIGGAVSVTVTFSEDTAVEENIDYIYIYDESDNEIGYYTGAQLAGQSVTVPGEIVKIRLESDESTTGYGFRVTNVEFVLGELPDIIRLLQHIDGLDAGLTDAEVDMNGDGKVTVFDAVYMLQNIAAQ